MQPDSLLAVEAVARVSGFLTGILPGLNEQFVAWFSKLVVASPIAVMIFANEWVGGALAKASPSLRGFLTPLWDKWRWAVNPALGALLGGLAGDSTMGLAAGALWGIVKGGSSQLLKADLAGMTRAKAIALVIAGAACLGWGAPAIADVPAPGAAQFLVQTSAADEVRTKAKVPFSKQLVFAVGGGVRYAESISTVPFGGVQIGLQPTNHLSPRIGLRYLMGDVKAWEGEAGLWLVW